MSNNDYDDLVIEIVRVAESNSTTVGHMLPETKMSERESLVLHERAKGRTFADIAREVSRSGTRISADYYNARRKLIGWRARGGSL